MDLAGIADSNIQSGQISAEAVWSWNAKRNSARQYGLSLARQVSRQTPTAF
jgi:hypothetical protein